MSETGLALKADHPGWSPQETKLLRDCASRIRKAGQPLRLAFEETAMKTGRMSGSVRNYYYAVVRPQMAVETDPPRPAFIPFGDEEVHDLLRAVLMATGKGQSVRQAAMTLADGDKKRMLRYQNKYRALLRTRPDLVREVKQELSEQGVPLRKDAAEKKDGSDQSPKTDPKALLIRFEGLLEDLPENGACALLEGLNAVLEMTALSRGTQKRAARTDALQARLDYLSVQLTEQQKRAALLEKENERLAELRSICRRFVEQGVGGAADLAGTMQALDRCLDPS